MATLTYDPTPADQPEFTEEELNSIEVGEQLAQQQEQLLAGKYENAQELERAYLELQSKLGQDQEESEEESEEVEEQEVEEEEVEESDEEEYEMTDEDVEALQNVVGGSEQYDQIIDWAKDNLSEQEISMYDHVMESNDPIAMFFAIRALGNSYENAVGVDGELLTGTASSTPQDVFRSQAEVVQAMSDPRYDSDPAYRQDVYEKLERSPVQF
jgi:citrate synthase